MDGWWDGEGGVVGFVAFCYCVGVGVRRERGSCSNVNNVCEKVWWGLLVLPFRRWGQLKHVKGYLNQISGDTGTSFDWV